MTTVTLYINSLQELNIITQIEKADSMPYTEALKKQQSFEVIPTKEKGTGKNTIQVNLKLSTFYLVGVFCPKILRGF